MNRWLVPSYKKKRIHPSVVVPVAAMSTLVTLVPFATPVIKVPSVPEPSRLVLAVLRATLPLRRV